MIEQHLRAFTEAISDRSTSSWKLAEHGVSTLHVTPKKSDACPFSVAWSAHEVIVGFGQGSRIELGTEREALEILEQLLSAIVAGDVIESRIGPRRSYQVTLADKTKLEDSTMLDAIIGKIGKHESKFSPY